MFSDAHELAKSLSNIYKKNVENKEWSNINCEMKLSQVAYAYYNCLLEVHEVYRFILFKSVYRI